MPEKFEIPADFTIEQIQVSLGAFYLCLEYAIAHIAKVEGAPAAVAFKKEFIAALKDGSINMSLLDDARTFDFVVPIMERLAAAEASAAPHTP